MTTDSGHDAAPADTGSDSVTPSDGPTDAPTDSPALCVHDTECADGLFCNGTERCMPGAAGANARGCVAAASPACSTSQTCDEASMRCTSSCPDADGDGHNAASCGGDDCDDGDPQRYPGRTEVCDDTQHDEDCDAHTFGFRDNDGDGAADLACCNVAPGGADGGTMSFCGTDCNDNNPNIHPGQTEACNGVDDNCNGMIDDAVMSQSWYPDCDGDHFGDPSATPVDGCGVPTMAPSCVSPGPGATWVPNNTDCDDRNAGRNPGATEVCDPGTDVDEDCNPSTFGSRDNDGDGSISALCCNVGPGSTRTCGPDCNDMQASIHPGATEVCNGADDDCNGTTDDQPASTASCTGANTTWTCTAGACAVASCNAGFANCRNGASDGCETNLNSSRTDCGACNRSCSAEQDCRAGQCELSAFVQIAAGGSFTCALRGSGQVICWGANSSGQLGDGTTTNHTVPTTPVIGLTDAVEIAAGGGHACARRASGSVVCWGLDFYGELGDGMMTMSGIGRSTPVAVVGLSDAVEISAGVYHTCARRTSGAVVCWGQNQSGQLGDSTTTNRTTATPVVGLTNAVQIATGDQFSCARRADATIVCWGSGSVSGDGTGSQRLAPTTPVSGVSDAAEIAAGTSHACVRRTSGVVQCWGGNLDGEIGDGTTIARLTPATPVTGYPGTAAELTAGDHHTCVRQSDGKVYCWGVNVAGQLGDGTTTQRTRPLNPAVNVLDASAISASANHTCALEATGQVVCWGGNNTGELGDGTTTNRSTPIVVLARDYAAQVSTGGDYTCARTAGRDIYCWGDNGYGNITLRSSTTPHPTPEQVPSDLSFVLGDTVSADTTHTCVVWSGEGQCWGGNSYGELGDGSTASPTNQPTVVGTFTDLVDISAGGTVDAAFTCARRASGAVYCWGANDAGQLGDNTILTRLSPVPVFGSLIASEVVTGASHTCARRADGTVVCWGANSFGQLGDGTTTGRRTPTVVTGLTSVVRLAAGGYHTCALRTGGQIVCWGRNNNGQLGDGTTTERHTFTAIASLTNVAEVSAGDSHTCARLVGGQAMCWGLNDAGQLGDGTVTQRNSPTAVMGVTDAVEIDAGLDHSCARRGTAQIMCWGANFSGQLGDASMVMRRSPVPVRGLP